MTQTNGQAITKTDPVKQKQIALKNQLELIKASLQEVVPKHVTPDRLIKVLLSATSRNPKLLECTFMSITQSLMVAGELGLELGGILGEAYLVPFRNYKAPGLKKGEYLTEAQCIPGYRGIIALARRSGEIESIAAHVVYHGEEFDLNLAEAFVNHKPNLDADDDPQDKDIRGAYVLAKFKGGGRQLEWMTRGQLEKVRKLSKAGNSGPWVDHYAEMCRKTVVRRASKYWPLSSELRRAFEAEAEVDEKYRDENPGVSVLALPGVGGGEPVTRSKALAERLRGGPSVSAAAVDAAMGAVEAASGSETGIAHNADGEVEMTEEDKKAALEHEAKEGGREPGED